MSEKDDIREEQAEDQMPHEDELSDEDLENAAGGATEIALTDPLLLDPDL